MTRLQYSSNGIRFDISLPRAMREWDIPVEKDSSILTPKARKLVMSLRLDDDGESKGRFGRTGKK